MNQSRIYHGGGASRGGFASGGSGCCLDKLRVNLDHWIWHGGAVSPMTTNLATTPLDTFYGNRIWALERDQRGFSQFSCPNGAWKYLLGPLPVSEINLKLFFYYDTQQLGGIVKMTNNLFIVRVDESVNYDKGGGTTSDISTTDAAYTMKMLSIDNVVVSNPSGLTDETECMFYLKIKRESVGSGDTFNSHIKLLGGSIEFPMDVT